MTDPLKQKTEKCLNRNYPDSYRALRLPLAVLALLSISACSVIASAAKEGALSVTGRSGWETFNLTGELPPEFGVKAVVWYAPITPSASCETDDIYSAKKRRRTHAEVFERGFNPKTQTFSFKVPLEYSVGLCALKISTINMEITGRYGEQDWQNSYDHGGLRFATILPDGSPTFDEEGVLEIVGKCEWLFQDSQLSLQLSKILKCRGAGAYLQYDQLTGKTVKFEIQSNPDERPYYKNTWLKFPEGWKPCLPAPNRLQCQDPPVFKTFKMNGKTCTIYPGCTE